MPTASNNVNKMDVEDPFIISDAIGIASSQQGKIISILIKHVLEGFIIFTENKYLTTNLSYIKF